MIDGYFKAEKHYGNQLESFSEQLEEIKKCLAEMKEQFIAQQMQKTEE